MSLVQILDIPYLGECSFDFFVILYPYGFLWQRTLKNYCDSQKKTCNFSSKSIIKNQNSITN